MKQKPQRGNNNEPSPVKTGWDIEEIEGDIEQRFVRVDVAASVAIPVDSSIGFLVVHVPVVEKGNTIELRIEALAVDGAVVDVVVALVGFVVVAVDTDEVIVGAAFNMLDVDLTDGSVVAVSIIDVDEKDAAVLRLPVSLQ